MNQPASRIDVRTVAPRDRHPLIFSTFGKLARGQVLELVNDHDPRPLYHQFSADLPGRFEWQYLEHGPDTWRVAIKRTGEAAAASTCCGSCGGA
jgi:uncharacterized protein (DUF2249 family)